MLVVFTHLHKSIIMSEKLQLNDVHVQHIASDALLCFPMFIQEEKKIYCKAPTDVY